MADGDHENAGLNAEEVGEALTATQIDLIRQTIRKCWHFPAGLKNAEDLVVDIEMELSPDGKITKATVVDKQRMDRDPDFKIAAESAVRAVMDDECNKIPLPKEKYNEWKDITLSFNPKDMLTAW
jgi:membrane protein involved in colicin uptake